MMIALPVVSLPRCIPSWLRNTLYSFIARSKYCASDFTRKIQQFNKVAHHHLLRGNKEWAIHAGLVSNTQSQEHFLKVNFIASFNCQLCPINKTVFFLSIFFFHKDKSIVVTCIYFVSYPYWTLGTDFIFIIFSRVLLVICQQDQLYSAKVNICPNDL